MPKTKSEPKKKPGGPGTTTTEALGYIGGLHAEFCEQACRYHELTRQLLTLQARVDLQEKNLVVTRDHLALAIEKSEEQMPPKWIEQIKRARFVGMRLADACIMLVKESKRITHTDMLNALNKGLFRFRTNAPLREIHGAMVRQPFVKRVSDGWMWTGPDIVETPMATAARSAAQPSLRLVGQESANGHAKSNDAKEAT